MNGWESVLPFVLIIAVFWLLVVRPSRNQQKRLAATQAAATIGTDVMLGSGIYGRIVGVDDDMFHVEVAAGTTIRVAKQAVVRTIEPTDSHPSTDPVDPVDPVDPAHPDQDR